MEKDITLGCVNVQDGKVFGVHMALDAYIFDLKKEINDKKMYTRDPDDLTLYLAKPKERSQWLAVGGPAVRNLRSNVVSDEIQQLLCDELLPTDTIEDIFKQAPTKGVVHVLVVPPEPPAPPVEDEFDLGVDSAHTAAWAPYVDAAKLLADDPQVLRLVDELKRVTTIEPTPFVVLEN
ncbi:hypothetical protein Poli38472_010941 [Pythium oligandrum]|uniref:Crinkler effector protein N-terminal domain-containing protein n=1 Tax=Pythium oligandrum TaxID=41045 RepID=A0A8K1CF50_PYTOL|nr:hypothetical protein Poli38472_010941 [Pythium oligandrum]|eukprot:TMW61878.1 hypothetical protein Poli38472_010941 [Pythium oligandrum]